MSANSAASRRSWRARAARRSSSCASPLELHAVLFAALQQAEADFDVVPFHADCARAFGVAAALRTTGRKSAARAYDALIAASAIAYAVPLYTCDPDDFTGIPRLDLRPVTHPRDR
jgi:predicted nucleic acid-binding protein